MKIETKYPIGDAVAFKRVIKRANGKTTVELHVGLITKVVVEPDGFHYVMQSSFSGAGPEEGILHGLDPREETEDA